MSEIKKTPTFSWLIRRAEALLRKDPSEYALLRTAESTKLLPGCRVSMSLQDRHSETVFHIKTLSGASYATVRGMQYKGVFYTRYKFDITPTKYRKRMHKYLPITLPEGARCNANTPCIYHNLDGSVAKTGEWEGGRQRRSGRPDLGQVLCFIDSDGTLVSGESDDIQHMLRAALMDDSSTPIDLLHGFLPGSCHSKIDWYDSMECPEVEHYRTTYKPMANSHKVEAERVDLLPGPLWDTKKMKLLAARAHSSALAFVKKFPHMRLALYPMAQVVETRDGLNHHAGNPLWLDRFHGETRQSVVLGRDKDDDPITYYLPQLVVWWSESVGHKYPHAYHAEMKHFQGLRFVQVVVPPVGCESLSRGPGDFSARNAYHRPGPKDDSWSFRHWVGTGKEVQERACHKLLCHQARSGDRHIEMYRIRGRIEPLSELDNKFHDWQTDQSKVYVTEQVEGEGQWQDSMSIAAYACDPSQVFSHMEEKELLDSLPMC